MTGNSNKKEGARRGGAHHDRDGAVERRGVGERLLRVARLRPHLPRASEPRRAGSPAWSTNMQNNNIPSVLSLLFNFSLLFHLHAISFLS